MDVKSAESVFTDCGSAFVPNYGSSAEYKSKKKHYILSLSALRFFYNDFNKKMTDMMKIGRIREVRLTPGD